MAETTGTISAEPTLNVSIGQDTTYSVSSNTSVAYVDSLDSVGDIDVLTNGKVNGSLLVYRTTTNKWTSTTMLDAQNMEGGEF